MKGREKLSQNGTRNFSTDRSGQNKNRRFSKVRFKRDLPLYFLMLPGILYFIIYRYIPMYGVVMAFQDFRLVKGFSGSEWVGLKHFKDFFTSAFFPYVMKNTLIISLGKLLFGFPAPIILALMLNEVRNKRIKKTLQTVVYLPHFVSWVVIGNLISIFFGVGTGVIPTLFKEWFGVDVTWLIEGWPFRIMLILSDIWKNVGWGTIIYMAALTSVDPTLYEAAALDGASRWQQILHITLPCLIPLVTINLILRIGGILDTSFEQLLVMQNKMVYMDSVTIEMYAYERGFVQSNYGFGAAVGLFQSVVGLVMVMFANWFAKKYSGGGLI